MVEFYTYRRNYYWPIVHMYSSMSLYDIDNSKAIMYKRSAWGSYMYI